MVGLLFSGVADAAVPVDAGLNLGLDLHTRASQSSPARTFVLIFIGVSSWWCDRWRSGHL
jgi:hypothetical protein